MSAEPSFARRRASPVLRFFLKVPVLLYRGPIADLLRARCVMLLTTRGRRSGRPRTGPVSFMPVDNHFIVFSGWGVNSNWYRNVRANPEVTITVGRRRMRALARLVEDPEQRRALMLRQQARSGRCGPPKPVRPVLKFLRMFDYDGEITMGVAAGTTLPVIEITPVGPVGSSVR
ncbi:MAG TPA: nitroreductase family deazaflavin-dependent oxidoreductase [Chloroflexota bacterium]|nr:nitroreductase family deazaflavin-dependent oxidoreductase [Chloroflexota bacterium]